MARPSLWRRLKHRAAGGASSNVFRGMAVLLAGSSIGRLIGLAAMPVLTRIYAPEDFGVLSVFTALVAMLAPLVTLRYVLALPLPRHDGTAMNLMVLSLGLTAVLSLILALLLWFLGEPFLQLFSMDALVPWWWLIAIAVLTTALYEILTYWATRKRAYRAIASTNVRQSLAGTIVKLALGFLALRPEGLLIGQVVAQAGGTTSLWRNFRISLKNNFRHVQINRIYKFAWRYRGFPIYRIPTELALRGSIHLPIFFFAFSYPSNVVGQIAIAITVTKLPVDLIAGALSRATMTEFSAIRHNKNSESYVAFSLRILSIVAAAGLPFAIVGFLYLGEMFPLIFGQRWDQSGNFAAVLVISAYFQAISNPITILNSVMERHRFLLIITIQRIILITFSLLYCGFLELNPLETIWVYSLVTSFHYMISLYFTIVGLRDRE